MSFEMPTYKHPDFTEEKFVNAPNIMWEEAPMDGVAPEHYHSTSMYPEYFKVNGIWMLAKESRMDSSVIIGNDDELAVVENRNLKKGDKVVALKKCVSLADYSTYYDKSDEFEIGDELLVSEIPLSEQYYQYVYVVTDIFGNEFYSKSAGFEMKYSKESLEEKPLKDGEYAADIIYIDNVDNDLVYDNIK